MISSQEMGSSLVSLLMIFEGLQSEPFKLKFHSLGSIISKNPGIQAILYSLYIVVISTILKILLQVSATIVYRLYRLYLNDRTDFFHRPISI